MKNCKKCGCEFTPSKGLLNFCSLQCRNSRNFSSESKDKKRKSNLTQIPWNRGLKNTWIKTSCLFCGEDIDHPKCKPKKYHPECWLKSSGGYRKGSGVGKKGYYQGYWCDSSWELAWVIYNLEHNIIFERNKNGFIYKYKNKEKKYFPDFIINGVFYEIKGRKNFEELDNENKEKIRQFKEKLIVLYYDDIKQYIDYVINKYGNDYIKLYDNGFPRPTDVDNPVRNRNSSPPAEAS
jgi:hypothetical protein